MNSKRYPWSGLTPFQWLVHLASWFPLAWLILDSAAGRLSVNPIQDITLRTGKAALWLLVLSLAATPANTLLGFRPALKVRRALGLYAFGYVLLHLLVFIWLDYGLDFSLILDDVGSKRYVLVGFSAFLILLSLAITSTQGWMKRLGKNWKRLHRWVYLAGVLAVVHYIWLVKSDIRQPLAFGAAVLLLLAARIPPVRTMLSRLRPRLQGLVAGGKAGKLSF